MKVTIKGAGTFILLLLAVFFFNRPIWAQGQEIIKQVDDAKVGSILSGLGIEYEKLHDGAFRFQLRGYQTIMFHETTRLQLYAGFLVKAPLTKVNEWNMTRQFSRAYLDPEGDVVIESDLDLVGGVTRVNIEEFFRTFRLSVSHYAEFFK